MRFSQLGDEVAYGLGGFRMGVDHVVVSAFPDLAAGKRRRTHWRAPHGYRFEIRRG